MNHVSDIFWNASLDEIKNGYIFNSNTEEFICLICGKSFLQGLIYKENELFLDALKAVKQHIAHEHSSMFDYLLSMDRKITGLTDHQKNLLELFYKGYSDNEIVKKLDGGSSSTIRNHRFTLKQKEKQSKVFLAIMELLEENKSTKTQKFVYIHGGATMVDERYDITEEENISILNAHFKNGLDGPLSQFPRKEKKKIAILRHIAKKFEANRKYKEKEVNEILENIYFDYVTLRRYLIEYGFLDRKTDCSLYWVKEKETKGGSEMDRKSELKLLYKETNRPIGVYCVKNTITNKSYLGTSTNIDGKINSIKFQLQYSSLKNKDLLKEWQEYGEDNFVFETLDVIKPKEDKNYNYKDDLKTLLSLWLEKTPNSTKII